MHRTVQGIGPAFAILALMIVSCSTGSSTSSTSPATGASTTSSSDIPAGIGPPPYVTIFPDTTLANCGPGSVPESGLQGQVPLAIRQAGFKGFSCNLQLQSKYPGQGATYVGTWYGHCFYMPTDSSPKQTIQGVQVVDISDPSNTTFTTNLDAPGMDYPHEGLRASSNGLLIGYQNANMPGRSGNWMSIYNIKDDCTHPKLLSTVQIGPPKSGHEGEVSPDGKTYYVGVSNVPPNNILAIDISDPINPKLITTWTIPMQDGPTLHIHGLGISADGKIGYLMSESFGAPSATTNGLMIVDLSQVQERKTNPQIRIISTLFYHDGTDGQMAEEFKLAGHPNRTYVVAADEAGAGNFNASTGKYIVGTQFPETCDGYGPFSFGRIIDVTDARVPTQIAQLRTQVQDPKNCPAIIHDYKAGALFGYNAHYCGVDNPQNATAIACGYFEQGVRVFDIRDPYKPKEIAYYNPPPNPANVGQTPTSGGNDPDPTADWASSWSEFYHAPDGTWNLIIMTQENGVQVLKFTNGAYPLPGGSNVSTPPPY